MLQSAASLPARAQAIEPTAAHATPPIPAVAIPIPTQTPTPAVAPIAPPLIPPMEVMLNLEYSLTATFSHSFSLPVVQAFTTLFVVLANEKPMPMYPPRFRK